jgi:hypothetical protein
MIDHIDIDETWFNMTEIVSCYITTPNKVLPVRKCKHKSHIKKIMFLTAVVHPRKNPITGEWWDGKIGTWFFAEQVPAKLDSKNLELHLVLSSIFYLC